MKLSPTDGPKRCDPACTGELVNTNVKKSTEQLDTSRPTAKLSDVACHSVTCRTFGAVAQICKESLFQHQQHEDSHQDQCIMEEL